MIKKLLAIFACFCTVFTSYSQVETKFSFQNGKTVTKDYPRIISVGSVITLPAVDTKELEDREKSTSKIDSPFRFGRGLDVCYSLDSGQWVDVNEGRIWNLSFAAKGALSLNFVFEKISLPDGAYMYITNMEENVIYGPVTNNEIVDGKNFLSDIIPGDNVTINLYEPIEHEGESVLIIKKIVLGFRSINESMLNGMNGSSATCNVDVACNSSYEKESKGIGLVLLASGEELCSGSLVMSADMTFKPYFLTAFHCIDIYRDGQLSSSEISDAENWMFKFYHKKQQCNGSQLATSYTYNKAYLRSAWFNSDFALMEIKADLKENTNLVWLGWENTSSAPTSGAGIHHPAGDVMKISIENNTFQNTTPASVFLGTNGWTVDFDSGVVEGGSSGSPILNQDKKFQFPCCCIFH